MIAEPEKEEVLAGRGLLKRFLLRKGPFGIRGREIIAVRDLYISLKKNLTYGLVGESGCGKTTLSHMLSGLLRPDKGEVFFRGRELYHMGYKDLRWLRKKIQMVFQDPYSSLNPRLQVGYVIKEALFHAGVPKAMLEERALEILHMVGLERAHYNSYPHQLSGGQRQRVVIARAISMEPHVIILDEPVSSLDVLIQGQILRLFEALKASMDLTYLFISHDLKVVAHISERIGVMYKGEIIEEGPALSIYREPLHPYTVELLRAVPRLRGWEPDLISTFEGTPDGDLAGYRGCLYQARCPRKKDRCTEGPIPFLSLGGERKVRCLVVGA